MTATWATESTTAPITPTVTQAFRRAAFWIVAGVGALLVAVVAFVVSAAGGAGGPPLAADNPAPAGSMAVVEVLRQQGVTVVPVSTLGAAQAAATADSTLFFTDGSGYLTTDQIRELGTLTDRMVVADPDFRALQALAPAAGFGGVSTAGSLSADCEVPAAERAETLSPGGKTLRLPPDSAGYTGCFPGDNGTFSVVERVADGRTLTLVADTAVFSNDSIAADGNAALALNLLGSTDTVIWYLPTLADVVVTGPPSLGALTPGWVTPVLLLMVGVAVAAMVWRGRRFGPLVAENLPVVVRASETMEGRARLYARNSARLRAVDAIRMGAVSRMARSAGLPRSATLDRVIRTVAALTGRPVDLVHAVLVGDIPAGDAEMIALSDAVGQLENATTLAVRPPSGAPSPHSPDTPPSTGRMEP